MIGNLTPKEYIELRLKCLEPYVTNGSKNGIEKNIVIDCARSAWAYAIEGLGEDGNAITNKAAS